MARREALSAGLEPLVAQPRLRRGGHERAPHVSPDHECLLAAAGFRAAPARRCRAVAPLDRHVLGSAGRYRGLAGGAPDQRPTLSCRPPLGSCPVPVAARLSTRFALGELRVFSPTKDRRPARPAT